MTETNVFSARDIITMNTSRPHATHVAVRDGRILGAGSLEDMEQWAPYTLIDDFADKILVPGFVEGHAHAMEGGIWDFPYVGYEDRWDPSGRLWEGAQSLDAVIAALTAAEARLDDAETPLFA